MKTTRHGNEVQILIVDDDAFSVYSLQSILKINFNLKSDFAYCGEEAISKVMDYNKGSLGERKKNYRLIFMDLNMPNINGIQTTESLKKL